MSAKEKQRFEEMAEKDKGRYDREMENFDKSGGGRGGKRKRPKDPNAPKRALSVAHVHILNCVILSVMPAVLREHCQ